MVQNFSIEFPIYIYKKIIQLALKFNIICCKNNISVAFKKGKRVTLPLSSLTKSLALLINFEGRFLLQEKKKKKKIQKERITLWQDKEIMN